MNILRFSKVKPFSENGTKTVRNSKHVHHWKSGVTPILSQINVWYLWMVMKCHECV